MQCEYADCFLTAVATIHAQWTVVDFVDYAMCDKHWSICRDEIATWLVDDQEPFDIWIQWHIPGEVF